MSEPKDLGVGDLGGSPAEPDEIDVEEVGETVSEQVEPAPAKPVPVPAGVGGTFVKRGGKLYPRGS